MDGGGALMTPVAQPTPTRSLGRRLTNKLDSFVTAAHSHDYVQTLKEIEDQLDALTEALKECEDYFDNRADVNDGSYGEPIPNTEMRLLEVVRAALNQVKP